MRLLVTADLHYNHRRSKPLADDLIDRMSATGGDVLLVVGDTASSDGDALEQCLSRFRFPGPKLFVAGNHELWTSGADSHAIYREHLPRRVRELGWHWLEAAPFVAGDVAIVGSIGWYDYSFAQPELGIPLRFYRRKISPGTAHRLGARDSFDDVDPAAMEIFARWNDGRFVKLHRSDEEFLGERLEELRRQLESVRQVKQILAAVHHLPFHQLLPPRRNNQWDFAKAFLGSERIGELLRRFPNLGHVICGHSHLPMEARVDQIHAINIGSGYRFKTFRQVEMKE